MVLFQLIDTLVLFVFYLFMAIVGVCLLAFSMFDDFRGFFIGRAIFFSFGTIALTISVWRIFI